MSLYIIIDIYHTALLLVFWAILSFYLSFYASFSFYTSVNWLYFTGFWVSTSLTKSPGLNWLFKPISTMLLSGWSWLFWFPILQDFWVCLRWPFQECRLQLVVSSHISLIFSCLARSEYFSIFLLSFIFFLWSTGNANSTRRSVHFFLIN